MIPRACRRGRASGNWRRRRRIMQTTSGDHMQKPTYRLRWQAAGKLDDDEHQLALHAAFAWLTDWQAWLARLVEPHELVPRPYSVHMRSARWRRPLSRPDNSFDGTANKKMKTRLLPDGGEQAVNRVSGTAQSEKVYSVMDCSRQPLILLF